MHCGNTQLYKIKLDIPCLYKFSSISHTVVIAILMQGQHPGENTKNVIKG